ncbi:MAG: hypothetical protein JW795_02785 [Chitinivibrionales bacterium]|nr:hypothetical protein [Chitinivibrionales bacterium]
MHKSLIFYFVSTVCTALLAVIVTLDQNCFAQATWVWRNPLPAGESLLSIVSADKQFVAVGSNGAIVTSSDGAQWNLRTTDMCDPQTLVSVTYGKNRFVAAGKKGTILTSHDGITWKSVNSGILNDLNLVTFLSNRFYAVSDCEIISSSDGEAWTIQKTGYFPNAHTILFGNKMYVLVYNGVQISYDGVDWIDTGFSYLVANAKYVAAYGNGQFVLHCNNIEPKEYSVVVTSNDGVNWEETLNMQDSSSVFLLSLTFGNNLFVASAEASGVLFTSPDGKNWAKRNSGFSDMLSTTVWCGDAFVAVPHYEIGTFFFSADGIKWEKHTTEVIGNDDLMYNEIIGGNGTYVAVGTEGIIASSPDAKTWRFRNSPIYYSDHITSSIFAKNIFCAVGHSNWRSSVIWTSPDGNIWTRTESKVGGKLACVAYGNDRFVAVSGSPSGGPIITSRNGIDWTVANPGLDISLNTVCYGNNQFVAMGQENNNTIVNSPDGDTWTKRSSEQNVIYMGVVYGNDKFVAVGLKGVIATSLDGITWKMGSFLDKNLRSVVYGNNTFVTVGEDGVILTSGDGYTWQQRLSETSATLLFVTYARGRFWVTNSEGAILTSKDGISWMSQSCGKGSRYFTSLAHGKDQFVIAGSNAIILSSKDESTAALPQKYPGRSTSRLSALFLHNTITVRAPKTIPGINSKVRLEIVNFSGRSIYSAQASIVDGRVAINAESFASGTYCVVITAATGHTFTAFAVVYR